MPGVQYFFSILYSLAEVAVYLATLSTLIPFAEKKKSILFATPCSIDIDTLPVNFKMECKEL